MIEFDEETHTYTFKGKVVPGVTSILAPLNDFENVPWEKLERAREFGQHVHQAVEWMIEGTLDWSTLDPALLPYVKSAEAWLCHTKPRLIESERVIFHDSRFYAGKLDLHCEIKKRKLWYRHVIDFKTGAAQPKAVGPQTWAYKEALQHEIGRFRSIRGCVLLTETGRPKHHELRDDFQDDQTFKACRHIYRMKYGR